MNATTKISLSIALLLYLGPWSSAQVLWEKTWGGPYDDGCEVRNTRDGGMIAMGSFGVDSWLMRLDQNGDTIWTNRIRNSIDLCAVTETLDGGFLATGTTRTANRDIVAWKFNVHGDSLWMRIYADTLHTEGMYTVLLRPDSSFLITGYTSANGYDMLALHIDSAGGLLWSQTYGGAGFEGGTMAAPTDDGGYILSTTGGNGFFSNIWVVKIDSLGDTVWTRNYVEPFQTGGPVPTVTAQGNILIMGWIQPSDYDNYLLCLDPGGNPLWSKTYGGIGFESRTARGIIEDRYGGYTFASSVDVSYGPTGRDHDIALYRLDSAGNVQRMHRVGRQGHDMPRYFEQTYDGDYVFFGFSTSFVPFGQQTYLARLHPVGCGQFFYDLNGPNRLTECPGDSLLLDAGAGYLQYLWSDGDTNRIRPVSQSDTMYVQVIDSNGCINHSSGVIVTVHAGPRFTWVAGGGSTILFDGLPGDGTQLLWDFGDGSTDAIEDPQHQYVLPGSYLVCLQAQVNGCGLVTYCDSVTVVAPVQIEDQAALVFAAAPNPSENAIQLSNRSAITANYKIRHLNGALKASGQIEPSETSALDVSDWAAGVYLLEIDFEGHRKTVQRLVIAR